MTTTGIDQVVGRLKLALEDAKNEKTERAITAMLIEGGNLTIDRTPKDDGFLIASMGRQTWDTGTGYAGAVYFGAHYADDVHDMPGTLRGQPRAHFGRTGNHNEFGPQQVREFGGGSLTGRYWDDQYGENNAVPKFLTLGMEEMGQNATVILESIYAVN